MDEHPLFSWGVGVCGGAWLAPVVAGPAGAVVAILAVILGVRLRAALPLGLAVGLVAGLTVPVGPAFDGEISVVGTVVGAPGSRSCELALSSAARPNGPWTPQSGRILLDLPEGTAAPNPGDALVAHGRAGPIRSSGIPGQPDAAAVARRSGIERRLQASAVERVGAPVRRDTRFDALPYGSVLAALALGDRAALPPAINGLFQRTGTTHVLSISGLHVALVAAATGGLLASLLRLLAGLRTRGVSVRPAILLGAATGVAYAYLTGASAAAQRSAVMLAATAVAHAWGRAIRPLDLLGVAAAAIVLPDPASVASPGFLLSFGAMLGLVRVTATLSSWIPPDLASPLRWPLDALATTVGATIGTLPATAVFLGTLSPTSPIANLLVVPWYSLVVTPAALLGLAPGVLGSLAMWAGDRAVAVSVSVLGWLDAAPLAVACTTSTGLILALPLLHPRRETALAVLAAFILAARDGPRAGSRAYFLDVGQGDAAYLELPDGQRWLVDGGPPSDAVLRFLRQEGVGHLDVVVASHGHPDHTGGLLPVLENVAVDELWIPDFEGTTDLVLAAARQGTRVRLRPPATLHPAWTFVTDNLNDRSLVLRVDLGGVTLLLPGDAEAAAEDALPDGISADILKVPHHGSHTSSTPRLLDRARPSLAVISCGGGNRFGHPHADVLDRYRRAGIDVERTDLLGTIEIEVAAGAVRVRHGTSASGWSAFTPVDLAPRWWDGDSPPSDAGVGMR